MNVLNIYGEDAGEPVELPYIKKTGDTATGLIIFDAGIEVNNGTTAINGPAEFADTVLFKPSSTIVIDGSLQLTGPSFEVDCQTTDFNGDEVNFNSTVNFGSNTNVNNTPVINTYRSELNIGDGGQGSVNVETQMNFGGFGSLNLLNADITMTDDSVVIQNGTRTIPNEMYTINMIGGSHIEYPDNTQQDSAYTGAGALAGAYTSADITLDASGKITAISNGTTPTNLSVDSLQIPIGGVDMGSPQLGGINVQINNGAMASFSGSGAITSTYVNGNNIARKGFRITLGYNNNIPIPPVPPDTYIWALKMQVTFTVFGPLEYYGNNDFGQTSFTIDFYPSTWTQPVDTTSSSYSLSNSIGGQTSYAITPNALAPNGRQYWVYNKQFQSIGSGYSGWLVPVDINTWLMTFYIPGDNSTVIYNYSACLQVLDCTSALVNGYGCGIDVIDINS